MQEVRMRMGRVSLILDGHDCQVNALGGTEFVVNSAKCTEAGLMLNLDSGTTIFLEYPDMPEYWELRGFHDMNVSILIERDIYEDCGKLENVEIHGEFALFVFDDFQDWRKSTYARKAAEWIRKGEMHPQTLYDHYPWAAMHPAVAPEIVSRVCSGNLPPKPKGSKYGREQIELYRWYSWYRSRIAQGRLHVDGSLFSFVIEEHHDLIPKSWKSDPADSLKKLVYQLDRDEFQSAR